MSADRDVTRVVRSWLDEGVTALPDRVLDAVLDQIPATPQRHATWWRARRYPTMSKFVGIAVAAAAIIAAVLIGYRLLGNSNVGPTPLSSPAPSPTVQPTPSATPFAKVLPPGEVALGRHEVWLAGVPLTINVEAAGWVSDGVFGMTRGQSRDPDAEGFIFWLHSAADTVFSDPCNEGRVSPAPERTMGALAEAITTIPGIDVVTAPTDVTVGGRPAKHVVIRVRDDIACQPDEFYLWEDLDTPGDARFATDYGFEVHTWIIEADDAGTLVWIDGETYKGAGPGPAAELQKVIDSIQFE